ncbi:MAG: DUF1015 domain-containing protein [Thermodesulfobacteriota bacterium]|nr:DUF1015 domain-containing protein [Thermodesulfobacteriota bacterium]
MARVVPLRGILYNPEKTGGFENVVSPPYDVISSGYQKVLCDRHPHNVVRLILGEPGENTGENPIFYGAAAQRFDEWRAKGILAQDSEPAFYLSSVTFSVEQQTYTRYGIIAEVGLEPFDRGVILPHERTSSKVKADRLLLTKATKANFSPIFSLFSDDDNRMLCLIKKTTDSNAPDVSFVDDRGEKQCLWRITDGVVQQEISRAMADKQLFIADGHHRYETALAYRQWVADQTPDFSDRHPADYVLMYLSSMADPGLVILPAHRLLKGVTPARRDRFLEEASACFDIQEIPATAAGLNGARQELMQRLQADTTNNTIGCAIGGRDAFFLLTPKPRVVETVFSEEVPPVLRTLDVTVLTRLILIRILGYTLADLDDEQVLAYTSIAGEAFDAVSSGDCDMAFLLNPTTNDQMKAVAGAGEIMPRKSTFYYPKVFAGLVLSSKTDTR